MDAIISAAVSTDEAVQQSMFPCAGNIFTYGLKSIIEIFSQKNTGLFAGIFELPEY